MLFAGYKTSIRKKLKTDFQIAEYMLRVVSQHMLEIPGDKPLYLAVQYSMSRQLQTFDGLVTLCMGANGHAAAVLLRVMIEDCLLLKYWEEFGDRGVAWQHARIEDVKQTVATLRTYYQSNPNLMKSLEKLRHDVEKITSLKTEETWRSKVKKRTQELCNKLSIKSPSDGLTGLFLYDVLYQRYSHFVHPTGQELGRYVAQDDTVFTVFDTSDSFIAEIIFGAMQCLRLSYSAYLNVIGDEASISEVKSTLDEWEGLLGKASFLQRGFSD